MRFLKLFHVSQEKNIKLFEPRIPTRTELDQSKGLVWAVAENCLPNFLTPRNCPRVAYYATSKTTESDIGKFFSSKDQLYCVAIENKWWEVMTNTTLFLYEFDPKNFYLQDKVAGYYVSEKVEKPIQVTAINNLLEKQFALHVEIRMLENLWGLAEAVKQSTLNWSLCRMKYAQKNNVSV